MFANYLIIFLCSAISISTIAQTATPAPSNPQPAASAKNWTVHTLPTRTLADGKQATVALAIRKTGEVAPKHILLFPSPYSVPSLKVDSGETMFGFFSPWVTGSLHLRDKGAIVAFLDAPSDVDKRGIANRSASDLTSDLKAAVQHLKKLFPGLPVHLTAFGAGVGSCLRALKTSATSVTSPSPAVILEISARPAGQTTNTLYYSCMRQVHNAITPPS